ncbi:glycosyltransferase family 4 protein [Raoultella ornithinolytica]|uniref:glycosyltransferase n=1 Tax=Raoultella ornithinolytica TaxID=54291 RepID=UPI002DBF2E81|nr:glycosyltransferase family 4 protein [Raoultella ornithinolytica]EKV6723865.1 glycosyltransferase [Raoultella ornithinolytica]MEB7943434.1 glycosyltransferase family 4 protein [Raoultella ornithinolytica]
MKILFLTTVLPIRARSGGEIVSQKIIDELLLNNWKVDVIGYTREIESGYEKPVNYFSAGVRIIETKSNKKQTFLWLINAFIKKNALSVQKYIDRNYIDLTLRKIEQNKYAYIFIDHTQMLWILDFLPTDVRVVLISHNVESELYRTLSEDASGWVKTKLLVRESLHISRLEKDNISKIDQVWALSESDKSFYENLIATIDRNNAKCIKFDALPVLTPDLDSNKKIEYDISILGTWTWDANMQGLQWFFEKVYPLLSQKISIHVAGKGADWLAEKFPNVTYRGFVNDAHDFMVASRLILIPSIAGAGVQIKTLDAITVGRPIIATNFALRGLEDYPSYVHAVDQPTKMAEIVNSVIKSSYSSEYISLCTKESTSWYYRKKDKFKKMISENLEIRVGE